jgi:hypothetical protein
MNKIIWNKSNTILFNHNKKYKNQMIVKMIKLNKKMMKIKNINIILLRQISNQIYKMIVMIFIRKMAKKLKFISKILKKKINQFDINYYIN